MFGTGLKCPNCGAPVSWAIALSRSRWPGLCRGCGKPLIVGWSRKPKRAGFANWVLLPFGLIALWFWGNAIAAPFLLAMVAIYYWPSNLSVVVGTEGDAQRTRSMAWVFVLLFIGAIVALWFLR